MKFERRPWRSALDDQAKRSPLRKVQVSAADDAADRAVGRPVATRQAVGAAEDDDLQVQAAPQPLREGALEVALGARDTVTRGEPPAVR